GLSPGAIESSGWPVQVVSSGIRQLFVPVRALAEVQALSPQQQDAAALSHLMAELDPEQQCNAAVMVLTLETVEADATVHTRMFAPDLGVGVDPTTGTASRGLGAYLIEHGIVPPTPPTTCLVSEQGIELGRPSRILIEVDGGPGAVEMVRVGGEVVPLI